MVISAFSSGFREKFSKIRELSFKEKIVKQFSKILNNPEVGKSMKYARKGTREVYIGSFRLSYVYIKEGNKIIFLDLYYKDEQ